jgi:hypothetical protein
VFDQVMTDGHGRLERVETLDPSQQPSQQAALA